MKKIKTLLYVVLPILIAALIIYWNYPKQDTFSNLVLNKYSNDKNTFDKCFLSNNLTEIIPLDNEYINKFFSYFSQFKLKEIKSSPFEDDIFEFYGFTTNNNILHMIIYNNDLISISGIVNGKSKLLKYYKIIDKKIDIQYINELIH